MPTESNNFAEFAGGLYLHPALKDSALIEDSKLAAALGEIGLTGETRQINYKTVLMAGPRFAELVVFMGCSPQLVTQLNDGTDSGEDDPELTANLIYIQIIHLETPVFAAGKNCITPNCPTCKQPLTRKGRLIRCKSCDTPIDATTLNWRKTAGVVQNFLYIHGVYPFEAIPSEELLSALNAITGSSWKYFYIHATG